MEQHELDSFVQKAVGKITADQPNHFLLTWEGTKIPRGAFIDDYEITRTQNGFVQGKGLTGPVSERIGRYERLEEFGGENRHRHVMLISTEGSDITFSKGTVQKIAIRPQELPQARVPKNDNANGL